MTPTRKPPTVTPGRVAGEAAGGLTVAGGLYVLLTHLAPEPYRSAEVAGVLSAGLGGALVALFYAVRRVVGVSRNKYLRAAFGLGLVLLVLPGCAFRIVDDDGGEWFAAFGKAYATTLVYDDKGNVVEERSMEACGVSEAFAGTFRNLALIAGEVFGGGGETGERVTAQACGLWSPELWKPPPADPAPPPAG